MATDPTQSPVALAGLGPDLERIGRLADSVGQSLARALGSAIKDGAALDQVLQKLALRLSDLVLTEALKPVGNLLGSVLGQGLGTGLPVKAFAQGGILEGPALFPMAGGLGLAGERGAEAILPLSRGPDGRLGLAGGSAPPVNVHFNVTTSDAQSFAQSEAELSALLLRAVRRGLKSS